jgi:hypothetical protein
VFVRTEQKHKFGGHLIIVLPEFDGRGGGPPSYFFFLRANEISVLIWG